ncbi:MAG: DUF1552 domain-containing protein, partial [Myxococcota bacterium]
MPSRPLSRRTLLRGAGGAALGLPFLDAMLRPGVSHANEGEIPRRVVFFLKSKGIIPDSWWPSGDERNFTLGASHSALAPFQDDIVILDGLQMMSANERSGGRNGHDVGTGHVLTATAVVPGPSGFGEFGHLPDGSAGGPSIDQHIASALSGSTAFDSLVFGVRAEGIFVSLPSRISYTAPFQPVTPMNNAGTAFDRIFGPVLVDNEQAARLRRRRELVLGRVQGDINRLRSRLGPSDQQRLDLHINSVEEIAGRIDRLGGAGSCDAPVLDPAEDIPGLGRAHLDMIAKSLECDLTRVAVIQWGTGQSNIRHPWLGLQDAHHSISHRGESD